MHNDRANYIYVDYENIRDIDLRLIENKPVEVVLVIGRQQNSLPKELVKQMLRLSPQVSMIENEHVGKNALDFVLVYEVAKQALQDPKGYYHIVSKDKGFDALVLHLKSQKTLAARTENFAAIPILADFATMPLANLAEAIQQRLAAGKGNRPARKKTLLSQISAHFGKALGDDRCEAIMTELIKRKAIELSATGAVTYPAL